MNLRPMAEEGGFVECPLNIKLQVNEAAKRAGVSSINLYRLPNRKLKILDSDFCGFFTFKTI